MMTSSKLPKNRQKSLKRLTDMATTVTFASSISASPENARCKVSSNHDNDFHASEQRKQRQLIEIIEFLKLHYLQEFDAKPLTLDEIAEECKDLSPDSRTKDWLISQTLPHYSRIAVQFDENLTKFHYKPPLELKGTKRQERALLNLVKARHETCERAITVDDVHDSTSKADTIIKKLENKGQIMVYTGSNKINALFYNDHACSRRVNSEFIEQWRTIPVDHLDDKQLCQSLEDQGHTCLAKEPTSQVSLPIKSSRQRPRTKTIKHNTHIADQLQFYADMSSKT